MANRTIKLYKGYFNESALVILFNGFQKKTQKTPKQQIERAKKLMNEYFKEKENGKG